MRVNCSICGFEADIKYGNYCARCKNVLMSCKGNCVECVRKLNNDHKADKTNRKRVCLNDTSTT